MPPAASPKGPSPTGQLTLGSGYRLGFARFGDPAGRPLLYFHGWPGSALQAALADDFGKAHGWNILAFDRPGMGASKPWPGIRLEDWPPIVAEALDIFRWDRCHLLAVSGGAPGAHACVAQIPERFRAVGLCCGAPPLAELDRTDDLFPVFRLLRAVHARAPGISHQVLGLARSYLELMPDSSAMRPWLRFLPRPDREALRPEPVLRRIVDSVRSAYVQGPGGLIDDANALLARWSFDWRHPSIPLTFWHGAQDRTIPLRMARWTAGQIEGPVAFHELQAEGHYSLPIRCLPQMFAQWNA